MSTQNVIAGCVAAIVVAAAIGTVLVGTRKNRVELTGQVLKVRTHQSDAEHTIALIDMRVTNPSTQQFLVNEVEVFVEEADGKSTPTDIFAETDIRRLLGYYKTLGEKYSPGLLRKDKINSGETTDRSFAVSAPMTDERLAQRKAFRIVVHDADGAKTEIRETR